MVLTDIYSAGEAPLEGVSTQIFLKRLQDKLGSKLHFAPRAHLEEKTSLLLQEGDVVLALGAGDISAAARGLFTLLEKT